LFSFAPAAPQLVALAPAPSSGGEFILRIQGQPGARYFIQTATNLSNPIWMTISTNVLVGNTIDITNTVAPDSAMGFWRAVWRP
jgi:hypothetical protein